MKKEYVQEDELANEAVREDLLKNQGYYRQKGKRFTESAAGITLLLKPGPPEAWIEVLPDVHRLDKAQLAMLIEENLIPRKEGTKCLRALREMDKEDITKKRVTVGGGIFSGENYLIQEFGEEVGGLIHLGRSTGDLITGTVRMGMRNDILEVIEEAIKYREVLVNLAEKHIETPFPTYTGLQVAQVTSFAHFLLDFLYKAAHACEKLKDNYRNVNLSPMGAAIGTGSDFPLNTERLAELLGFDGVIANTLEAISNENKTFTIETFGYLVLLLSAVEKLCAFLFVFHTNEYGFVRFADRFCGTSSIMPQKRNPVLCLYTVSKIHSVYAASVENLFDETALVSWPRGGSVRAALEDTKDALVSARINMSSIQLLEDKINENLMTHWACASDLAGALVREANLSWRTAHQIVSILCRHAEERCIPARELNNKMIEEASMEHMGKKVRLSEDVIKSIINPLERIKARTTPGGPAPENVKRQVQEIKRGLGIDMEFIKAARKKLEDADRKLDSVVDNLCEERL